MDADTRAALIEFRHHLNKITRPTETQQLALDALLDQIEKKLSMTLDVIKSSQSD